MMTQRGRHPKPIDERKLFRVIQLILKGYSKNKIADELHTNYSNVLKYINEARNRENYVVVDALPKYFLEEKIKKKYGLKDVLLVDYLDDTYELVKQLGEEAAKYFIEIIKNDYTIVLGGGNCVNALINKINKMNNENIKICAFANDPTILSGNREETLSSSFLATRLKENFRHESNKLYLLSPQIPKTQKEKEMIFRDPNTKKYIATTKETNIVLFGVGDLITGGSTFVKEDSTFVKELTFYEKHNLFKTKITELKEKGCVGQAAYFPINKEGEWMHSDLDKRIVGMKIDDVKRIAFDTNKYAVAITTGKYPNKNEPTLAAIKGKWLNVLITDSKVGEFLIKEQV